MSIWDRIWAILRGVHCHGKQITGYVERKLVKFQTTFINSYKTCVAEWVVFRITIQIFQEKYSMFGKYIYIIFRASNAYKKIIHRKTKVLVHCYSRIKQPTIDDRMTVFTNVLGNMYRWLQNFDEKCRGLFSSLRVTTKKSKLSLRCSRKWTPLFICQLWPVDHLKLVLRASIRQHLVTPTMVFSYTT